MLPEDSDDEAFGVIDADSMPDLELVSNSSDGSESISDLRTVSNSSDGDSVDGHGIVIWRRTMEGRLVF